MAWDTRERGDVSRRWERPSSPSMAGRHNHGRIAGPAGINKERLYKYFCDKQALLDVLTAKLEKLPPRWNCRWRPQGHGDSAGRTFDYHAAHPSSPAAPWEGLPTAPSPTRPPRPPTTSTRRGPTRPPSALGILGDDIDPDHLLLLIIGLSVGRRALS